MAGKQKSWFGVWGGVKPSDLNRLLKPFGCRLLSKGRRQDDQVLVTAEPLDGAVVPAFRRAEADALLAAAASVLAGEFDGDGSALEAAADHLRGLLAVRAARVEGASPTVPA